MTHTKIILISLITSNFLLASSGASIYRASCKSCHGLNGDKLAMNKSRVIAGMSVPSIEKAMLDYASGARKSISLIKKMKKDFVRKHSKEDLHAVAHHINQL